MELFGYVHLHLSPNVGRYWPLSLLRLPLPLSLCSSGDSCNAYVGVLGGGHRSQNVGFLRNSFSNCFFTRESAILSCFFVCLKGFFLRTGLIEYYNVVTLEIRFFLFPRVCCCWLLRAVVVRLFSDFSKLFLQRLYSLPCMATAVSASFSSQSASNLTEITLNAWS